MQQLNQTFTFNLTITFNHLTKLNNLTDEKYQLCCYQITKPYSSNIAQEI